MQAEAIVIFFGLVFIDGRLVKRWMPQPKVVKVSP